MHKVVLITLFIFLIPADGNTNLKFYGNNNYYFSFETGSHCHDSQCNKIPDCKTPIPEASNEIPVEDNTVAVPCYKTNDLIILLDSSRSITSPHYETAKQFVKLLAEAFTVHKESRIAFLIYGNTELFIFGLQNSFTPTEIGTSILSAQYLNEGTKTWFGVDAAIAEFERSPRTVPLNMVILTDGGSNDKKQTIESAEKAGSKGIRSFVVGIGEKTNKEELLALAGNNPDRIFETANFDKLIEILAPLSRKICSD